MSESTWFYTQAGQRSGPVPLATLQMLISGGEVNRNELAWTEGMEQWAKVSDLPVLVAPKSDAEPVERPRSAVPLASPFTDYSSAATLPSRASDAFVGHASPTGDSGDWPLDQARVSQFAEAGRLHRRIMAAARTYQVWMVICAALGVLLSIVAVTMLKDEPEDKVAYAISIAITFGIGILYFFAWRSTRRCRRWAPLTMCLLYLAASALYLIVLIVALAGKTDDPTGAALGSLFVVAVTAPFAIISWRAYSAIPRFLQQPAWCQELLIRANT